MTVAIIGAGPSGLALAKQLLDRDIEFVVYERDNGIGGVWNISNAHSVMYESAHTISSKTMTEFSEFPMPETFTDYISHRKMLQYLESYAKKYNLLEHILFGIEVKNIKEIRDNRYELTLETGQNKIFHYVAIATGHVSKPNHLKLNIGDFDGQVLHASTYKEPSIFKNKKVLVIGAGNSGCDIACEAVALAEQVSLSIRRGYHFIPKFLLGMPADVFGETSVKLRLPMFLRQIINQGLLRFFQGNIQKIGFPKPNHRIFESHPIVNELLIYHVRHGDINIKNDVKAFTSRGVIFFDDSKMEVDLIICATGYEPDYSFLDDNLIPKMEETHLNLFSKKHAGLSFLGFVDPNGGVLGLIESQAIAVAESIALNLKPDKLLSIMHKNVPLNGGIKYINSERHQFEVDHATYRREINKLISTFKRFS